MVAVLVHIAEVDDVQLLASQQFKAKSSELAFMTPHALVNGDQKVFTFKTDFWGGSVGFAVIETTDDEIIMARSAEILESLAVDKLEKNLDCLFLAVVNIVYLRSNLLMVGPDEKSLAIKAFENGIIKEGDESYIMDLGGLVSRKKDFIPKVTAAVKAGWKP